MKIGEIEIKWLGHSGFLIKNSKTIYIDPYKIKESEKADLILITHGHYENCSVEDLSKIVKDGTRIVATADCQSKINRLNFKIKIEIAEPKKELTFGDIKISVFPAYNINRNFHSKDEGWVGYLIKIKDNLIYHSGDTDVIPEMKNLTGYNQLNKKFIALLPINGRFTMSAEEAVEFAKLIKPSVIIPMNYENSEKKYVDEFIQLCKEEGVKIEIPEKE